MIIGVIILILYALLQGGIITVDWGAVSKTVELGADAAGGFVQLALHDLSAQLAGFSAGVVMGFKFR